MFGDMDELQAVMAIVEKKKKKHRQKKEKPKASAQTLT